jgi:hypothetical protein
VPKDSTEKARLFAERKSLLGLEVEAKKKRKRKKRISKEANDSVDSEHLLVDGAD